MITLDQLYRDYEAFFCTKETPWDASKGTPAQHPDVISVEEGWLCPHCGELLDGVDHV